jgi:5-methylcytosine-specific restriction enzyme A
MSITTEQIEFSCKLAQQVCADDIEIVDAARKLANDKNMNPSSARGYIETFIHMVSGKTYTRTINASATEYYFKVIHTSYDLEVLRKATESVRKHLDYYFAVRNARQVSIRKILEHYTKIIESESNLSDLRDGFEKNVELATEESSEDRLTRISVASKIPEKIVVATIVYRRNPDVAAEVLFRAKGVCERCQNKAPFLRASNDSPYLEVHHKKQLAHGGEDTVNNALALCPNCHRELHYGQSIT